MGRCSDSEDSEYQRSGRHGIKKKRSGSRTSGSDSSDGSHSSRHKRRKHKHRSPKSRRRSRSRSRDRKRRSRSSSRSRKPRSHSRSRRSTSRSRSRRSRSRSRQRRSRSNSRGRRSRSRSYDRKRSKRSRSRSRSDDRRHSSSASRFSGKNEDSRNSLRTDVETPIIKSGIPGFDLMTPLEQNEARMQLALRAADAAAERLKAQGVLDTMPVTQEEPLSAQEQTARRKAIEDIEDDTFKQSHFKSTGNSMPKKLSVKQEMEQNHDSAMFGLTTNDVIAIGAGNISKSIVIKDDLSLLAPVFFEDESKKMARWIEKLTELRRQLDVNSTTK